MLAIASTVAVGEYWAALVVAFMITGGSALQDFASARARGQVNALLTKAPRIAHVVAPSGEVRDIPVEDVAVGERVLLKPGEMVPVDATLLDQSADFDESSITGESIPVTVSPNEQVPSGAINGSSAIYLRAVATAGNSQYQQIIALVAAAASTKARFVRMADRASIPFTAVSLGLAVLGWILSGDPARAAEVLVAATPCPLLIAAPVAFVAGMGNAARNGVIVKSGDSLEALARLKSIAFDKTGTLTMGAARVERVEVYGSYSDREVLAVAAAAEAMSPHVLARAVVNAALEQGVSLPKIDNVAEAAGEGVTATWHQLPMRVGKASFAAERIGWVSPPLPSGATAVVVSIGNEVVGRIVMRDASRTDARAIIGELREIGIRHIMMLTGDSEAIARNVARKVGIDEVHASLRPTDKVNVVAAATDRPIAMVGDGVNDAPVLAAADIGIAMGARGATAASESADVVIMVDDLDRLPAAIRIARHTVRIATQSIYLGIGLSLALMAVATTGIIPAIVGAIAQEAIDVVTIANGLRATRSLKVTG